jgi:hypothetical protein
VALKETMSLIRVRPVTTTGSQIEPIEPHRTTSSQTEKEQTTILLPNYCDEVFKN